MGGGGGWLVTGATEYKSMDFYCIFFFSSFHLARRGVVSILFSSVHGNHFLHKVLSGNGTKKPIYESTTKSHGKKKNPHTHTHTQIYTSDHVTLNISALILFLNSSLLSTFRVKKKKERKKKNKRAIVHAPKLS